MDLRIIVAISENNVIGYQNNIPWYIPEDLKRFRKLTMDHPAIMGRKTYESIFHKLGHPLDKRENIVLTKHKDKQFFKNVHLADSLEESLKIASKFNPPFYVIGGESIYELFLPQTNIINMTRIHKNFKGDSFFPKINLNNWEEINYEDKKEYSFIDYKRK